MQSRLNLAQIQFIYQKLQDNKFPFLPELEKFIRSLFNNSDYSEDERFSLILAMEQYAKQILSLNEFIEDIKGEKAELPTNLNNNNVENPYGKNIKLAIMLGCAEEGHEVIDDDLVILKLRGPEKKPLGEYKTNTNEKINLAVNNKNNLTSVIHLQAEINKVTDLNMVFDFNQRIVLRIKAFKNIYTRLPHKQTTDENFLADKNNLSAEELQHVIETHIKEKPKDHVNLAWKLAKKYFFTNLDNMNEEMTRHFNVDLVAASSSFKISAFKIIYSALSTSNNTNRKNFLEKNTTLSTAQLYKAIKHHAKDKSAYRTKLALRLANDHWYKCSIKNIALFSAIYKGTHSKASWGIFKKSKKFSQPVQQRINKAIKKVENAEKPTRSTRICSVFLNAQTLPKNNNNNIERNHGHPTKPK